MATIAWESYYDTPSWGDIGGNRLVFSGSDSSLTATVTAEQFQDGTHLGNGTPGTDQCGTTHVPNVKIISDTEMSVNGGATETINDTNLDDTECSFRLHFNDGTGYALQTGKIYAFDGTDSSVPAIGVDAAIYVKGEGMSAWHTLNSDSTLGDTMSGMDFDVADIGGDNSGSYLELAARSAATDHYFYVAVSVSPESAGGKSAFALGAYFEYY